MSVKGSWTLKNSYCLWMIQLIIIYNNTTGPVVNYLAVNGTHKQKTCCRVNKVFEQLCRKTSLHVYRNFSSTLSPHGRPLTPDHHVVGEKRKGTSTSTLVTRITFAASQTLQVSLTQCPVSLKPLILCRVTPSKRSNECVEWALETSTNASPPCNTSTPLKLTRHLVRSSFGHSHSKLHQPAPAALQPQHTLTYMCHLGRTANEERGSTGKPRPAETCLNLCKYFPSPIVF